ncbi:MAG: alpha-amylase/4-alpha-glucanotransferase domain-containing protein [Candidatus Bathyarchaeia archaeon]
MIDGTVNYPFVVHFHQPVGQLERVLERVYRQSYELWLRIFQQHPKIKFSVHFSGCLLEWIAKNHPEYLNGLKDLASRGQIEFIGGGFYEPILPIIPDEDKLAQIRLLSSYLTKTFGLEPTGCWLAERVWEPSLPKPLTEAGMKYVLIDDCHLRMAGYQEEETFHAYFTEEQGHRIAVFPINERLRYLMLWNPQEKSIEYLNRAKTPKGDRIVVYITDAEKYGEWSDPAMAELWLDKYLSMVEQVPWITPVHLVEYLNNHSPKGLVYLPSASYDKMVEWSGGNFRNFLAKYEESNNMHKKMFYVRGKIKEAENSGASPELLEKAWIELHKAQCNDAYWHGLFGGVYLPNLRQAVYHHLIQAEVIIEQALEHTGNVRKKVKVLECDFDYDGRPELLLESLYFNVYVKPDEGGNIFELDYKGKMTHNFAGTLTRKKETYHDSWAEKPVTDWYRRTILRDHLLKSGLTLRKFLDMEPLFDQGDFVTEKFEYRVLESERGVRVKLSRLGYDWSRGYECPLLVTKTITVPLNLATLSVRYEVKNVGKEPLNLRFAPESTVIPPVVFEYTPTHEELTRYPCVILGANTVETNIMAEVVGEAAEECRLMDRHHDVTISVGWSKPAELWLGPLKAQAQTEKEPEPIYEGTVVMPIFNMELPPGGSQSFEMKFSIVEGTA